MATALEDLTAQVAVNAEVEAAALALIETIAAELAAAGSDPVALAALKDTLATSASALKAVVDANV